MHHVTIIVRPGGLGTRLDAMYEFHAQHRTKPQRGHGKHDTNGADLVGELEKDSGRGSRQTAIWSRKRWMVYQPPRKSAVSG